MFEGRLQNIDFDEGENLGGMRGMRFILPEWVEEWGYSVQGVAMPTILLDGYDWISFRAIEDSADFTDEQKKGPGATPWECDYQQDVAGDNIDLRMVIDSATRLRVIAEVVDNNGQVRRMGELNSPAFMSAKHSSGGSTAARNAWTISVKATHTRAAVFVPNWDLREAPYTLELPGDDSE